MELDLTRLKCKRNQISICQITPRIPASIQIKKRVVVTKNEALLEMNWCWENVAAWIGWCGCNREKRPNLSQNIGKMTLSWIKLLPQKLLKYAIIFLQICFVQTKLYWEHNSTIYNPKHTLYFYVGYRAVSRFYIYPFYVVHSYVRSFRS